MHIFANAHCDAQNFALLLLISGNINNKYNWHAIDVLITMDSLLSLIIATPLQRTLMEISVSQFKSMCEVCSTCSAETLLRYPLFLLLCEVILFIMSEE